MAEFITEGIQTHVDVDSSRIVTEKAAGAHSSDMGGIAANYAELNFQGSDL